MVAALTSRTKRASLLVLVGVALAVLVLPALPGAHAATANPVSGSVSGPGVVATQGNVSVRINATGGPAVAANGTLVGNLTYYASVSGTNLTGVSISPTTARLEAGVPYSAVLTAGGTAERLTVTVMVSSVLGTQNVSNNFSYSVPVVRPYVLSATIVNTGSVAALGFPLVVRLDGYAVGTVRVPTIPVGGQYNLSFEYPTLGLAAGDHTFSISLANAHGLLRFPGGATTYSVTFYVAGPAPSYTLYYALGIVAVVGVVFIYMTRVAARRRGAVRK